MIPKRVAGAENQPRLVGKVEEASRYREELADEYIVGEKRVNSLLRDSPLVFNV